MLAWYILCGYSTLDTKDWGYLSRNLHSAQLPDSKHFVVGIFLMVAPTSQMICQIQISRSRTGRGEMGEGGGDIKCLDKGRDLQGAIMMDEMIHTTT